LTRISIGAAAGFVQHARHALFRRIAAGDTRRRDGIFPAIRSRPVHRESLFQEKMQFPLAP